MATGNGDRKKLGKVLVPIIITAIVLLVEMYARDSIPKDELPTRDNIPQVEQTTQNSESQANLEGELTLTMIDVGQADSFLLMQNEEVALIDCGTRSTGKDVVEYLKSLNIIKIDYLFGTHPHDDHMGGMYDVITNFEIGKIILPDIAQGEVTTNWYLKLMQEITDKNYDTEDVKLGAVYNLGNAIMQVIGPISEPKGNLNNYSTVLKVSFGEVNIIMTGDAEKSVEAEILDSSVNLEADILKVGHHGSDTSSSTAFLEAINPKYALISAKVGNKYKHPIEETMQNLKERDITVYRTDECGTVIATITQDEIMFSTEPGDYLSGVELAEKGEQDD